MIRCKEKDRASTVATNASPETRHGLEPTLQKLKRSLLASGWRTSTAPGTKAKKSRQRRAMGGYRNTLPFRWYFTPGSKQKVKFVLRISLSIIRTWRHISQSYLPRSRDSAPCGATCYFLAAEKVIQRPSFSTPELLHWLNQPSPW